MRCSRWPKRSIKRRSPKNQRATSPKAHKETNYIYGGPDSYESRRKQKLTVWEVIEVSPATPEYLKWSKVPITFDRNDHLDFIPKLGRYPLIVSPIVKDASSTKSLSMEAVH
jgi:hypothetical protein